MARHSSIRFVEGNTLSILDGVPVVLKENFECVSPIPLQPISYYNSCKEKDSITLKKKNLKSDTCVKWVLNIDENFNIYMWIIWYFKCLTLVIVSIQIMTIGLIGKARISMQNCYENCFIAVLAMTKWIFKKSKN